MWKLFIIFSYTTIIANVACCSPQIMRLTRRNRSLHSNPAVFSKNILTQNIMEQNSADVCLPSIFCTKNLKYRSIDGTCNNLAMPSWGSPNTAFVRLFKPSYSDEISKPRVSKNGRPLPSPRLVHTVLFPRKDVQDSKYTLALMQWGQVIAHDVTLLSEKIGPACCSRNGKLLPSDRLHDFCFPIAVPIDDAIYSRFGVQCLDMKRLKTATDLGCNLKPEQQVSFTTHYLDGSLVYGSNIEISRSLRTFNSGLLRFQTTRDGRPFLSNVPNAPSACNVLNEKDVCYRAGDFRVNQNSEIAVSQVMFMRLHNFVASQLGRINTGWNDDKIFEEARRIVIAILQHVTYNEYLPSVLGSDYVKTNKLSVTNDGYALGYDDTINPSTIAEFAGAAFRSFHSTVQGSISLVNESRVEVGEIRTSDWMNRPGIIQMEGNYDYFLRGLVTQPQQAQDIYFNEEISHFLFKVNGMIGNDLLSLDINRGRDMGIPSYVAMRQLCGLSPVEKFEDLKDLMDDEKIRRLSSVYSDVADIDYLVGGLLERIIPDTLTGPSFRCVLAEAFFRYKFADRFYYEFGNHPGAFTLDQLQIIRGYTLSMIFCITSDNVKFMQPRAFLQIHSENRLIPCSQIVSFMNFEAWREF